MIPVSGSFSATISTHGRWHMPDAEIPQFRVSNEGDPIPPVEPEDLKRVWKIKPGDKEAMLAERARDQNHSAI